jgi:vancomycin resistance protein VanJ
MEKRLFVSMQFIFRRGPVVKAILTCLVNVYLVGALALVIAQRLPINDWWGFQLAAVFHAWIYMPLPLVALGAFFMRKSFVWSGLALLTFAFTFEYGAQFLPHSQPVASPQLRVMSWNTLFTTDDAEAVSHTILAEEPDIVALQELGTALAPELSVQLRTAYPYQALSPKSDPGGFGILSRYPLADVVAPELGTDTCRCQQVTILLPDQAITLLNVHPNIPRLRLDRIGDLRIPSDFQTADQDRSFDALMRRIDASQHPLLVVGDFNLTDRQRAYSLVRGSLQDAFASAGWGFGWTFPAGHVIGPLIRIDYILMDAHWTALRAWTGHGAGSDHRYVVADLVGP